ncbi:uncharacterized protein PG986_009304 [Apiospora aurea]|uniref:Velvet domain-containing protein n=1 Tax=Apiospora aurea TaxID=335848 RepID=A0ABR1Q7J7_9PEZI
MRCNRAPIDGQLADKTDSYVLAPALGTNDPAPVRDPGTAYILTFNSIRYRQVYPQREGAEEQSGLRPGYVVVEAKVSRELKFKHGPFSPHEECRVRSDCLIRQYHAPCAGSSSVLEGPEDRTSDGSFPDTLIIPLQSRKIFSAP